MQHPPKKRRIAESDPSKPAEANIVEMIRSPEQEGNGFDFGMNLEMDIARDVDGDYGRMGTCSAIRLFSILTSIYLTEQGLLTNPLRFLKQV